MSLSFNRQHPGDRSLDPPEGLPVDYRKLVEAATEEFSLQGAYVQEWLEEWAGEESGIAVLKAAAYLSHGAPFDVVDATNALTRAVDRLRDIYVQSRVEFMLQEDA